LLTEFVPGSLPAEPAGPELSWLAVVLDALPAIWLGGLALGLLWMLLGSLATRALARGLGRGDLVLPSILVGAFGTALGTYLGFTAAGVLL